MRGARRWMWRSVIGLAVTAVAATSAVIAAPAAPAASYPEATQEMGIYPGYAATQTFQQIDKRRIAGPQIMRRSKLRDHTLRLGSPGRSEQPPACTARAAPAHLQVRG